MGPYSLAEAICDYEQKFKDKTGHSWDSRTEPPKKGKYTFVQKIYEDPPAASGNKSKEFLAVRKTKKGIPNQPIYFSIQVTNRD